MEGTAVTMLKKIKALPKDVLESPFGHRDCVDLVRSVVTQMLHIHYIDASILFTDWQKGKATAEAVQSALEYCRKLLNVFGDVLNTHEDYSIYQTLVDQGKNRKVNPYFEDALKDNILNDYCRTAAYELVKYVYLKEADVFGSWVSDCIAKGQGGAIPKEAFEAERTNIFDDFKAMPLKDMHPTDLMNLTDVIDRLLEII